MDKRRSGCPKPNLLGPANRIQGCAVVEKRDTNQHLHFIISCRDFWDQLFTSLMLFAALDTVPDPREDPRDEFWQRDRWEYCLNHGLLKDTGRTRKFSPLLARFAPGGTAMVQIIRDDDDRKRVCGYMTKELGKASLSLAQLNQHWARKADFEIRELREFHSPTGFANPASRIRTDRETKAQILNLDDPHPWKWRGKRVH